MMGVTSSQNAKGISGGARDVGANGKGDGGSMLMTGHTRGMGVVPSSSSSALSRNHLQTSMYPNPVTTTVTTTAAAVRNNISSRLGDNNNNTFEEQTNPPQTIPRPLHQQPQPQPPINRNSHTRTPTTNSETTENE